MSFAALPWWLTGILLLAGLVLLKTGLWPRRRGETPHCPACNYNLTGLTSERCPECGTTVTSSTIVYGERHRRPVRGMTGAFLLCLSAGLAAASISGFNWYSTLPAALLIHQAGSSHSALSSKAWSELTRRIKAGRLSAEQRARLIDLALKEQASTGTPLPMRGNLLDFLGDCCSKGVMSQNQKRVFFDQMIVLSLTVRSPVVLGDRIPYQISDRSRSPSKGAWHYRVRLSGEDSSLDGHPLPSGVRGELLGSGPSENGSLNLSLVCKEPGKHTLKIMPEITVSTRPIVNGSTGTILDIRKTPLEATFEILTGEPPNQIRAIEDPAQANRLQAAITPTQFRWRKTPHGTNGIRFELEGRIESRFPSVDAAFDVLARIDGKEYRMGTVLVPRGIGRDCTIGSGDAVMPEQVAHVDVILRSSKTAAQATVDQFSFWEGELVYKDIPVKNAPATAPGE